MNRHKITGVADPSAGCDVATNGYVDRGRTVSSDLNMNRFGITNLKAPSESTDVATKGYVDSALSESRNINITHIEQQTGRRFNGNPEYIKYVRGTLMGTTGTLDTRLSRLEGIYNVRDDMFGNRILAFNID